ncbi:MAG TPA: PIG-L deacetylase family protein [Ktedonobacteraceae bacterium]|jgi:LmbE family N-acetylglucosaminyl deacetylase|nr:PIG-L deacetylase family protein [Ktedonobacteraceae bacterium]
MTQQEPELRKVALVVVAHPDDAEFMAAGTVATWAADGWDVHYVICTDASGGGPDHAEDVSPEARKVISNIRKREQRAACDVLGAKDIVFLDYPDGLLEPSMALRRDLVRVFRQYRPSRVICQSPDRNWERGYAIGGYHPDHLAAGTATISAFYPASQNGWDFPELLQEDLKPHKIHEIYFAGAPTANFAVDISATIDKKIESLRAHASQLADEFDEIEGWIKKWTVEIGKKHGMEYAEEFHRAENR